MAVYLNDAIWRRLSEYYNVTADQAQVGDLYKRWLDEKGLNWGTAGDFFISQFPGVLNRGDAEWLFWTGGGLYSDDLVLFLDAAQESQTGTPSQTVKNRGNPLVADAQLGSSTGVDSNDPMFLQHTGTNYVYLPGVSGNYLSVPDEVAFAATSSLQVDWDITPDTPGTVVEQTIASQFGGAGLRGWRLYLTNTPGVTINWSTDGTDTTPSQSISQSTLGMSAGQRHRGRVILRFDNGTGNYDVRWYTLSDTGVATLVETDTGVGTTSIFNTISSVEIGSRTTGGAALAGRINSAKLVIDGIEKLAFNTSVITNGNQTSFTAGTGQTVTINRSATGKKAVAVTRPCWLFGTNSYMTIPDSSLLDFGLNESFTVLALGRKWGNGYTTTAGFYLAKQGDPVSQPGYRLGYDATVNVFAGRGGGATAATGARGTAGEFEIIAGVRNVSADTFTVFRDGVAATAVSDSTTATLANSLALNVGRIDLAASSLYADMELFAVAVVRRALNATELEAIQEWFTVVPTVPPNPWAPPPSWSPLDLSPALWLDASDTSTITASSGSVSEWRDKSGNARHVSQGTAASQPTTGTATQNGKNVLSFDGGDFLRFTTFPTIAQPYTVVVMFNWTDITDNYRVVSISNGVQILINTSKLTLFAGSLASGGSNETTAAGLRIIEFNGSSSGFYLNSAAKVTLNPGTAATGAEFTVSARADGTLGGKLSMYEVIVVSGLLSADQRSSVLAYSQSKWGTP